jgi:4-amino-4-deoxy-L-arabinose transferase-like glycosyltransferase
VKLRLKLDTLGLLAPILALAVLLRLGVALYLGDEVDAPELLTDQRSYHALGARLVSGHGFSFAKNWYPFTQAEVPTSHWSFLYSLLVAGVYAVTGAHPLAMRLVQAVLGGLLLPWMVYRLAKALFANGSAKNGHAAEPIALVAALVAAVYPYFVLYSATLMTETFFLITLLWSLERALALANRLRAGEAKDLWPPGLSLGLSLGLATLLRQSILPWVPVLFLYLLWLGWRTRRLRATVGSLALAGLILIAFIAPFTVRNYLVYDDFLLLNSNTGYAMYSAQHPMHGTSFREFDAAPLPEGMWGRTEPELDRELLRQGIQFIVDDPGRYLLLSLSRVRSFFEFWPTSDTTLLHNIGRTGSFGLLLPFLLYGLVLALRRPGFVKRNALLFLFAAFYTVLHVMTWAMVRYRLPVDAALIPLAALAVTDLLNRARAAVAQHAA